MSRKNLRPLVFERDHGICAACGQDCVALELRIKGLTDQGISRKLLTERLNQYDLTRAGECTRWHADHVKPLWTAKSDEEFRQLDSMENLQTLCQTCHTIKSIIEDGHRAKSKRMAPEKRSRSTCDHDYMKKGRTNLSRPLKGEPYKRCVKCGFRAALT